MTCTIATTGVQTQRLVPTSRLVSAITGLQVQRNKAIVGTQCVRARSGYSPGRHAQGTHDVRDHACPRMSGSRRPTSCWASTADELPWPTAPKCSATGSPANSCSRSSTSSSDWPTRRKRSTTATSWRLIEQQLHGVVQEHWKLVSFEIISRAGDVPHVRMTLQNGGQPMTEEVTSGDGPVDAAFRAVEKITGLALACKDYQVRSATIGRDAQGEASLEIEHEGRSYRGLGVSTDTVEATDQGPAQRGESDRRDANVPAAGEATGEAASGERVVAGVARS